MIASRPENRQNEIGWFTAKKIIYMCKIGVAIDSINMKAGTYC